jgi:hypothetical protein
MFLKVPASHSLELKGAYPMLKRAATLVFSLSILILLTAMGSKGGFERVPRVEKNFSVAITDVTGHKIDGDKFSWEGRIRFSGTMGMAEVNVPFEKIKEVTVGEQKNDRKVRVTALLLDGNEASFDVDGDTHCYGETDFGSFMLGMTEIKTITFKGVR